MRRIQRVQQRAVPSTTRSLKSTLSKVVLLSLQKNLRRR